MTACAFPQCPAPARDEAATCEDHAKVTVSGLGSWVGDRHTASEGMDT